MKRDDRVHFVGVGGIGMSALAQHMAHMGARVSGSDRFPAQAVCEMLQRAGVMVVAGHTRENVPHDATLVVYSDAVVPGAEGHVERERATALGIRTLSYFEALGEATRDVYTIAVAGTHGKTTTTAMLVKMLIDAGARPTAIVGSIMNDYGSNYVAGDGALFVVEACEYKDHLRWLHPNILVITNIELDHTDWFADLAAVQHTFQAVTRLVPKSGAIVADVTHPSVAPVLEEVAATVIDYRAERVEGIPQTGFNLDNAKAARAAARAYARTAHLALSDERIVASLASFKGTWRRFEYKGKTAHGVEVYDDYAHHPTAIQKTIALARERFPHKEIVVLFHPHLYSRTKSLFDDFSNALSTADRVFILPIYPAREQQEEYPNVTSEALVAAVNTIAGNARYIPDQQAAESLLKELTGDAVLLAMGAGDVYKVAEAITISP